MGSIAVHGRVPGQPDEDHQGQDEGEGSAPGGNRGAAAGRGGGPDGAVAAIAARRLLRQPAAGQWKTYEKGHRKAEDRGARPVEKTRRLSLRSCTMHSSSRRRGPVSHLTGVPGCAL